MGAATTGRHDQRARTRKDLLEAASRLLRQGHMLTMEEVAAEAQVSRVTAHRYIPNAEMLVVEATPDWATPEPGDIFATASDDPVERVELVDDVLTEMMAANEPAFRIMLAQSVRRGIEGGDYPVRQNRRTALIEAALAPVRDRFRPDKLDSLTSALAVLLGIESMVVFTDVLQFDAARAREVRRWAIRALVDDALVAKPGQGAGAN
ncbi:TetR/AcrR family transcriptional regulator [Mycobacterium sp. CVI_P3]|uniref:TetR/AcrR family transcriptional regulator n=1 Tax=Mycobacterium pinniadriaticum TaxID=2994102 RepID=A0ABT3S745_9MYCO|nr:TetR/AcrR family transcriptional regulator [Mycobacterium pinniadriaticum]MCX2928819.1 TetR/AcrR family transcriptional regulator [Mycobacterium pinniadriaticum]MCX2935314.1 TetR/AcrR family transcriptional regulator [Mycobacterium pinniadriaticum]